MLKLYGFPVSNYTNMVELALLEKGLPFEYVTTYPAQTDEFLQMLTAHDVAMRRTAELASKVFAARAEPGARRATGLSRDRSRARRRARCSGSARGR